VKKKRTKPRPTPKKGERWPPQSREEYIKYLDELEAAECEDMEHDHKRREWKKSEDFKRRQELAEQFKKKKK